MAGTVAQSTPSAATEASKDRFILVRTVVLLGCDRPSTGSRNLRKHGQGMGTPDRPCTRDVPRRQDASPHHPPLPRCPRRQRYPLSQQPHSHRRSPPPHWLPRTPLPRHHPQRRKSPKRPRLHPLRRTPPRRPRHPYPRFHPYLRCHRYRRYPHPRLAQGSCQGQVASCTCLHCSCSKDTRRPDCTVRRRVDPVHTRSRRHPPASPGADPTAPARPPQHESSWWKTVKDSTTARLHNS
jgi:hypothetical protein